MSEFHHVSVLLEECIQGLAIKPDGIYVDGTLGGAGHSSRIAAKLTTGRLIGIDRDNVALEAAAEEEADPPQAASDRVMAPARNNAISFFFIVFPP